MPYFGKPVDRVIKQGQNTVGSDAIIDDSVIPAKLDSTASYTVGALNVDGNVTADGLTLGNANYIRTSDNASTTLRMFGMNSVNATYIGPIDPYAGGSIFYGASSNVSDQIFLTGANNRLKIANNGDISFYDSTGSNVKFFWDASEESLGIGTTTNYGTLDIKSNTAGFEFYPEQSTDTNLIINYDRNASAYQNLQIRAATHQFLIESTERMRIDSSGSILHKDSGGGTAELVVNNDMGVGARNLRLWGSTDVDPWTSFIGTNVKPDGDGTFTKLSDNGSSNWGNASGIMFDGANSSTMVAMRFIVDNAGSIDGGTNSSLSLSDLRSRTAMAITAGGNVGIGTTSPWSTLDVLDKFSIGNSSKSNTEWAHLAGAVDYTASTSSTDIFKLSGTSLNSAEITIIYRDFQYAAGSFIQKIYLSASGSGAATSNPSIAVENKNRVSAGTWTNYFTWAVSVDGWDVKFSATATVASGDGIIYVKAEGPRIGALTFY